jgi:hypothetical protein
MNIFPLSFSIPDECVVDKIPEKNTLLAALIPGEKKGYVFDKHQEKGYNEMYRQSRFALTKKKGGWDCLRHYEILMNGCIPLFQNLQNCPAYTLTTYPKHLNDNAFELYGDFMKNGDTQENIEKYNTLCLKYLEHTKNNCTSSATAKYFLSNIKNGENIKNILLISCDKGLNYCRETLWIGLNRYIHSINGMAVEYEHLPFLYHDYDHVSNDHVFTLQKRLEKKDHSTMKMDEIKDKINNHFWDLIIYGKVGPDEYCSFPFLDDVIQKYNKNEIVFLFGGDEIFNLKEKDGNNCYRNFFNYDIYYKRYTDYLLDYNNLGTCFVREFDK